MITVALRYDDFSSQSSNSLDKNLVASLCEFRTPCTFAVVPFHCPDAKNPASLQKVPLTAEKAGQLNQAIQDGIVEVALHGNSHQSHRIKDFSEFAGCRLLEQKEKISSGKAKLESLFGIPVTTFVPPWNTYDQNTLRALAQSGLQCISAFPNKPALLDSPLRFVPATCLVRDLRLAIGHARRLGREKLLVMAYFHPYEFKEENAARGWFSLEEFRQELHWLASQPDVEVKTIGAIGTDPAFSARTYTEYSRPLRIIPEYFSRRYQNKWGVYPLHARPNFFSELLAHR
jgi:peptidoglycan/xylan/chitin deacetylase (PgdA/CDA1 family)